MATTRDDIRAWLLGGKRRGATHVIVACDTFDHHDFPVYVMPGEDPRAKAKEHEKINEMSKVMEVYALHLDLDAQLREHRSFHYEMPPLTAPISLAVASSDATSAPPAVVAAPAPPSSATSDAEGKTRRSRRWYLAKIAPDPCRGEFKNVGVVLLGHKGMLARFCADDLPSLLPDPAVRDVCASWIDYWVRVCNGPTAEADFAKTLLRSNSQSVKLAFSGEELAAGGASDAELLAKLYADLVAPPGDASPGRRTVPSAPDPLDDVTLYPETRDGSAAPAPPQPPIQVLHTPLKPRPRLVFCDGRCDALGCRGHDVMEFREDPTRSDHAPDLIEALYARIDVLEKQAALDAPPAGSGAPSAPLLFDKRRPTGGGWWARLRGGKVRWFQVHALSDAPLSIYVDEVENLVPIDRFCSPLTRWAGPVSLENDEPDRPRALRHGVAP